jgi:Obg family GTPase CgtA-like protein
VFVVQGQKVEMQVAMTDMNEEEAVAFLMRRLEGWGVQEGLFKAGAKPGDLVRIGGMEFDFTPRTAYLEESDKKAEPDLRPSAVKRLSVKKELKSIREQSEQLAPSRSRGRAKKRQSRPRQYE